MKGSICTNKLHLVALVLSIAIALAALIALVVPPAALAQGPTPEGANDGVWRGYVIDSYNTGGWFGNIIVRTQGLAGVTVQIESEGGWSQTAVTGTKGEFGPYACEFPALNGDYYYIKPAGLEAVFQVHLVAGQTLVIDFVPADNPQPQTNLSIVRVNNQLPGTIRITIDRHEYDVEQGSNYILNLNPNTYNYTISSPGYKSQNGQAIFRSGYWVWNIGEVGNGSFIQSPDEEVEVKPTAAPDNTADAEIITVIGEPPTTLPVTGKHPAALDFGSVGRIILLSVTLVSLLAGGGVLAIVLRRSL